MHFFSSIKKEYSRTKCTAIDIAAVLSLIALVCVAIVKKFVGMNGNSTYEVMKFFYPLFSIFANIMLIKLIQMSLSISGVKLKKQHCITVGLIFAGVFIGYLIFLNRQDFIYYWDYSNYIIKQYNAEHFFMLGIKDGFKQLLWSLSQDYTDFINLFLEFPFCLTDKTGDSYALCQILNVFLPVTVLLSALILKLTERYKIQRKNLFFVMSMLVATVFPMLHTAATFSQPDWFGIIFCLIIILLTVDYNFEKADITRYLIIFVSTALLIVTRRWYMYFAVGYYFCYALYVLWAAIKKIRSNDKKNGKKQIINLLVFGIASVICASIIFIDMIKNILFYNYSQRYASYNIGGLLGELLNQTAAISVFSIIIIIGVIYALRGKLDAKNTFIGLVGGLISILMFTRVQTMGFHQHLLLLPFYYLLIFAGIAAAVSIEKKALRKTCVGVCAACIVLQPFVSFSRQSIIFNNEEMCKKLLGEETSQYVESIMGEQADKAKIEEVSSFIKENCGEEDKAYIIPQNFRYNSDIFRNVNLPDTALYKNVSYGFDVCGVHKFPTEIFEAKLVITASPFPQSINKSGLSSRLNDVFLKIKDEKFTLLKSFDMGDGYVFYVYERIKDADMNEISLYKEAFEDADKQFPDLFSQVIDEYLENKNVQ